MIFGIGIDIVKVSRFEDVIKRRSERFIKRLFTENEVNYCKRRRINPSISLSSRFAAKEAFVKSIGKGWKGGIRWKDIEVVEGPFRKPIICLHGRTKEIFEGLGLKSAHLSLSHNGDYSVAIVIVEG